MIPAGLAGAFPEFEVGHVNAQEIPQCERHASSVGSSRPGQFLLRPDP